MGPLSGYKVIEVTTDRGMFAGKLLHDLGAEVVRIEPADFHRTGTDYLYCNAGKHLVVLNMDVAVEKLTFNQLVSAADILIEDGQPGEPAGRGFGYEAIRAFHPGIIYASVTDFGQNSSGTGKRLCEPELQAAAGWLSVSGEPDRPIAVPGNPTWKVAGLFAVNGILLALFHRHETGRGQYLDISVQECAASVLDHVLVRQASTGETARRQGSLHWNNAFRVFPCRDGHILLSLHRQWETLVEWMASEGMAADLTDTSYRDENFRNANIGHIIEVVERWTKQHTAAELEETGQLMRFPWSSVYAVQDLLQDDHLQQRGSFTDIALPGEGTYNIPGPPVKMGGGFEHEG